MGPAGMDGWARRPAGQTRRLSNPEGFWNLLGSCFGGEALGGEVEGAKAGVGLEEVAEVADGGVGIVGGLEEANV